MLGAESDVLPEKILLQAALSHLELALANISEQAQRHDVSDDEREAISTAAKELEYLAVNGNQQQKVLTPSVGARDKSDLSFHLPGIAEKEAGSSVENDIIVSGVDVEQQVGELTFTQENVREQVLALEAIELAEGNQGEQMRSSEKQAIVNFGKSSAAMANFSISGALEKMRRNEHEREDLIGVMLKMMIDGFEDLDKNKKFAVDYAKLKEMSENLGCQKCHTQSVFRDMGKTVDGLVYQEEWCHICKDILGKHKFWELEAMIRHARDERLGHMPTRPSLPTFIHSHSKAMGHRRGLLMMSCQSNKRLVWDISMTLLLMYVAISLPLTFAFTDLTAIQTVDNVLDYIFTCDLILNFRTSYFNQHREEVWEAGKVARKYLRTWFVLDFFSSVPLEQLTSGVFPRLAPAKLLKFGKIAKAFKIIRMGKMIRIWGGSELMELFEEVVWSYNLVVIFKGMKLVLLLLVMGHWLSCALLSCGGDAINDYFGNVEMDGFNEYLVAMYWAMMTMTTVGYGDVAMINNWERLYAIVAMIIGGAFYGYIVGSVTTILSERDLNQRAFTERMELVVGWLNNHDELPKKLRRRIWRHFKQFLTDKQAVEDSLILNDLPPQLCNDVSVALLKDTVRTCPIFEGISVKGLCALVSILSENKFQADEIIVDEGERGKAMFVVDQGFVHQEHGGVTRQLCPGDSFGEEFLLREATEYKYTVRTHSRVTLFKINRDDFAISFKELPQDFAIFAKNYAVIREADGSDMLQSPVTERGASSLLAKGGTGGIPPSFPDAVLEYFRNVTSRLDCLHLQNEKLQHAWSHLDLHKSHLDLHKVRATRQASSLSSLDKSSSKLIVKM